MNYWMKLNVNILFVLGTLLILFSCSQKISPINYDLTIEIYEKEVVDELTKKLDERGIKYLRVNEFTIKYSFENYNEINQISNNVVTNDLPGGRAVTFPMPGYNELLMSEFDKNNIGYIVKYRRGQKWVVWDKKNKEKGNDLVNLISIKIKNDIIQRNEQ